MKSSISDLTKYYHSIETFKVDQTLFKQRCKRLIKRQPLTPALLKEVATLKPDAYFAKYAGRRTRMNINSEAIDVRDEYDKLESPVVPYPVFRDRLATLARKQRDVPLKTHTGVSHKAGSLSEEHWKYFIGSGRAKPFIYDGTQYPAIKGQQFLSVPSLLMEIGKLDIKSLVLSRLKQGFTIDRAISEEKYTPKDGNGWIYKLSSSECEQEYIGLTTSEPECRFNQHKTSARNGSGLLIHKEIRRYGDKTFFIGIVDSQVPVSELAERERHYIKFLNTLAPNGLNNSAGGQLGGSRGKPIEIDGVSYKSITEAGKSIEKETNGAVRWYSAESRIRNGEEMPERARKHSFHADAGTNLFRRHLGLAKRKQLCHRWLDYDEFKRDVLKEFTMSQIINQKLRLSKINGSKLYGPKNFVWLTSKEAIEARCGKPINAFGQSFRSMTAFAKHYGIPVSTVKYRMRVLCLTPEQAVHIQHIPIELKQNRYDCLSNRHWKN
ncbi:GIY-YIG nuclease family protein [Paraglaciecola sp. L3A3]|uniref:GIY-YIG nuclease family protein n=1 Tax=Paraglaciecola sp. L3A3 TaxID=2686358 RepID=UPI00131B400A|nr:GIY-YIG nuclease family protein [Paraglaciecola sp. L3A3]